ncbi:carbohydrate-binding protein [Streptomyces sp. NPDC049097]|uniref:carbohydrate-binding protein n=1 Tax=Streptomyces sp. NPDC049097 TaxID=3155497 RepID=UPI00341604AA
MNQSRLRLAALVSATVLLSAGTAAAGAQTSHGRTYYVSSSGSDTHSGSASAPFEHIQKCAAVMTAGDTCEIASGTYHESITPAHQGTAQARITYRAAPGASVTVDGTDPVSGWSKVTDDDLSRLKSHDTTIEGSAFASAVGDGHVYQATATLNPELPGNQVFVDGAMSIEAQWPYPGDNPLDPHWATAESGTQNSLSDTALTQPEGFWKGARLTARNWFVTETAKVTASSVGSLTADSLPNCISLSPNQKTTYSLSGRLSLLGHSGEWFYDSGAHTLYAWTKDGDSPAEHTVEAKQREVGFDLSGRSYTSLVGIGVRGTTIKTSATSTHDVLDRITARYVSAYNDLDPDPNMVQNPDGCAMLTAGESTSGIILNGTANSFRNSTVDWSAGNGVVVTGTDNTVSNNTITNVDYLGSYAAGINVIGSDHTITHNTVAGAGRSDLNVDNKMTGQTFSGNHISYNDFSGYNTLVTDGGAIYVCCKVDMAGSVLDHNLLHDPGLAGRGTLAPGIYLDNNVFNTTVHNNVAWNGTSYGVVLFNGDTSSGDKVYNNTSGTDSRAVSFFGGTYSDMEIANNIGDTDGPANVSQTHNLPYSTDPLFTDPLNHDYSLQAGSPARSAGVVRPPATDGYRDRHPDAGAYQYGVPKWVGGSTVERTTVQAERYSDSSGVARHDAGTGSVLGNFDGGDWVKYTGVDFGNGRDWFTGSIGDDPSYSGRQFQIRVDSRTGPVIGTVTVLSTGGFDTYIPQSIPITPTKGVHDIFLVALGSSPGVANLDSFSFTRPSAPDA